MFASIFSCLQFLKLCLDVCMICWIEILLLRILILFVLYIYCDICIYIYVCIAYISYMATPNFPYPKTPPKITIKIIEKTTFKKKTTTKERSPSAVLSPQSHVNVAGIASFRFRGKGTKEVEATGEDSERKPGTLTLGCTGMGGLDIGNRHGAAASNENCRAFLFPTHFVTGQISPKKWKGETF